MARLAASAASLARLQLFLRPLALADVLNLRNEVQGLAGSIANQRHTEENPDDVPELVKIPLLHVVEADLAREHLTDIVEIGLQVVGVRDGLKGGGQQLRLRVADNLTQ